MNFLDNCWDYNAGLSEERMGIALRDGYRRRAFVMTKIDGRSYAEAMRQIEDCLRRLETDCIDLVQHHEIQRFEDPFRILDEEGAQLALEDARKAGKLRFTGFTGHKDPLMHLRMLEIAKERGVRFERGAVAAESCYGCALPEFCAVGAAGTGEGADCAIGDEEPGQWPHLEVEHGDRH